MFYIKNRKKKICLIGAIVCCIIFLVVFYISDALTGDKEFSQYTDIDWAIAIPSLIIMAISAIASLTFSAVVIVPVLWRYPAINDYVKNKKFSGIDSKTTFIIFDFDEFKRACCYLDDNNNVSFSVKEYNLKTREWVVLQESRTVENHAALITVLKEDYKFDQIKYFHYKVKN